MDQPAFHPKKSTAEWDRGKIFIPKPSEKHGERKIQQNGKADAGKCEKRSFPDASGKEKITGFRKSDRRKRNQKRSEKNARERGNPAKSGRKQEIEQNNGRVTQQTTDRCADNADLRVPNQKISGNNFHSRTGEQREDRSIDRSVGMQDRIRCRDHTGEEHRRSKN